MDEEALLCEVLYVVLSPMDGYHAQGTLLSVHRVIQERYLGMYPGVRQVNMVMLPEFAARSSVLLRYLERLVKRNTCIVCRVSCRASLIPSGVNSVDSFFFHGSMTYFQIHTLFYAINRLKCELVILRTAELWVTLSPTASPLS